MHKELAYRENNGLAVTLWWHSGSNRLSVSVHDGTTGDWFALMLTHNTGGKPSMLYDGTAGAGNTGFVPPSIVVPEGLFGLIGIGLAVFIPLFATRLVRRRA